MQDQIDEQIKQFFTSTAFGVVGASRDRNKYGNKVVRCYMQHKKIVYPINAKEQTMEGLICLKSIEELPSQAISISIVTPPAVTEQIIDQIILKKQHIKNIWMQPGADSVLAIKKCIENNINIIAGGPCILVVLGFKEG